MDTRGYSVVVSKTDTYLSSTHYPTKMEAYEGMGVTLYLYLGQGWRLFRTGSDWALLYHSDNDDILTIDIE